MWRLNCGDENGEGKPGCCALHCLESQPDFKAQRSSLQEVLDTSKYIIEFYPKFHCQCNWLERYWAEVKRDVRATCDYSFSGLKERLPLALDNACPPDQTPTRIRRYFTRCYRYIDAYRRGIDGDSAYDEVVRKFVTRVEKAHRRLNFDE